MSVQTITQTKEITTTEIRSRTDLMTSEPTTTEIPELTTTQELTTADSQVTTDPMTSEQTDIEFQTAQWTLKKYNTLISGQVVEVKVRHSIFICYEKVH